MIFPEKRLRLFPIIPWLHPPQRPGAPSLGRIGVEQLAATEVPLRSCSSLFLGACGHAERSDCGRVILSPKGFFPHRSIQRSTNDEGILEPFDDRIR
jgi:hypothetical protein